MTRYRVVIADPPWNYNNAGCRGAAENHYPTMAVEDICALPVNDYVHDDSTLFLWTTWPQLQEGLRVIAAWGFQYVTGFPWIKDRRLSECRPVGNVSPASSDLVGLLSENLRHSRKPENIYHIAERLQGPYLEMFARRPRAGWDGFGNQVRDSIPIGEASA